MRTHTAHTNFTAAASNVVQGILSADKTNELWEKYYHSQRDENPANDVLEDLESNKDTLSQNPELLAFMIEVVAIERGAMKSAIKEDTQAHTLLKQLDTLEKYLIEQSCGTDLPKIDDLPEDKQRLLYVMRHHTGQNPFRPIKTILGLFKETGHHVKEEAMENPKSFATLLVASLGALYFMNAKLGTSATTYLDPEMTGMVGLDLDQLDNMDGTISIDPNLINVDLLPSCHDHLKQLFGETAADWITQSDAVASVFPEHCSRVKTLVPNAQQNLQDAYDFINLRIGTLIKAPAESLGDAVIPDSAFKQAFDVAAHQTAEFIYAANTIENVTLHSMIALTAGFIAYKAGTLKNEETTEMTNVVKDFIRRSVNNSPLSYAFGLAATASAYIDNSGFSPEMVWMGLGGILAGEFTHKVMRKRKQTDFVQASTLSVSKDLVAFSDPHAILSGKKATEKPSLSKRFKNLWRKKRALSVAGITAATVWVDVTFNQGQLTGYFTGGSAVVVPFLGYNAIEDTLAHIIFGIAGGATGLGVAGAVNTAKATKTAVQAYLKQSTPSP